ncbi:MAG: DUF58 domain-containing protein [Planctomycetaceae bacterium]|nr:DUF58 domain-containing protein [Planctomycetaceae bacterium]
MRNDPEVQQAVDQYQMGMPRLPTAGRSGEMLGRGTGSSIEFQEYREYLPGDDLRHVDWAAYARSDSLMVRLYREEISPRTEIILDASVSMTTQQGKKSRLAMQLTSLFSQLSGKLGGQPQIHFLNSSHPPLKLGLEALDRLPEIPFDGQQSLAELLNENAFSLKPQSVRIVVSDFLFPLDPDQLLKRLSVQASSLWLIQILSDWEANPETMGGRRLIDVETSQHADMLLTGQAIKKYRQRLHRLQEGLQQASRRTHASFVTVIADQGLERVCRNELSAVEILRPV